ncbi:PAS domain-containing protein [Bacillus piscicola]|uniref:PAS domain-containing protein n=1 Tax=Bacillus piscicola TaxID=1632684 RepID=UPI001F095BD9|nr:PAS domain-containing protein [Bacillus piscicola]
MDDFYPSKDLLKKVLNVFPSGVIVIDPDADDCPIVYVNKGFLQLTGYEKEEIIGKNSRILHGIDTPAAAIADIQNAITNRKAISLEIINYRKNGEKFWSELLLEPVYVESEKKYYFLGIQTDITEQKYSAEKINAYDDDIHSLSTPIIPIVDYVFALPIIGNVNEERLQHIFDDVTEAIYSANVETLILDLSGLHNLSDDIIKGLFTLHELLELLGSELIITGISPELAEKTEEIELDLNDFQTYETIKDAIVFKQQTP